MHPLKKIALIGANGMLASMLQKSAPKSLELHLFDLPEFDITDRDGIYTKLSPINPDIVINCAAFTQVDACETQSEIAFQVNGEGSGYLAAVVKKLGSVLIHISTDFVFSGSKRPPMQKRMLRSLFRSMAILNLRGNRRFLIAISKIITSLEQVGFTAPEEGILLKPLFAWQKNVKS